MWKALKIVLISIEIVGISFSAAGVLSLDLNCNILQLFMQVYIEVVCQNTYIKRRLIKHDKYYVRY
jgi:hypothetical protein